MKQKSGILFWLPRILCIAAILFISLFALDAFEPGTPPGKQIAAFLIHLIPSFILAAMLFVAWKWELVGGIFFTVVGVVFSPFVFFHNYQLNHSVGMSLGIIAAITIPFIVIGILFLLNYFRNKKLKA